MKKIIISTIIILLLFSLFYYFSGNNKVHYYKPVKVGVYHYPPSIMKDPATGKYTGFDIEILKAIAKSQKLKIIYQEINFDDIFTMIPSGEIDASLGITILDKREKTMSFTWPVEEVNLALLVNTKHPNINCIDDLKNEILGTFPGTGEEMCKQLKAEGRIKDFIKYDTAQKTYKAVLANKVAAILNDEPVNLYYAKLHKRKLRPIQHSYTHEYTGFPVNKKNETLRKVLNQGLKQLFSNGEYARIHKKYYYDYD